MAVVAPLPTFHQHHNYPSAPAGFFASSAGSALPVPAPHPLQLQQRPMLAMPSAAAMAPSLLTSAMPVVGDITIFASRVAADPTPPLAGLLQDPSTMTRLVATLYQLGLPAHDASQVLMAYAWAATNPLYAHTIAPPHRMLFQFVTVLLQHELHTQAANRMSMAPLASNYGEALSSFGVFTSAQPTRANTPHHQPSER